MRLVSDRQERERRGVGRGCRGTVASNGMIDDPTEVRQLEAVVCRL